MPNGSQSGLAQIIRRHESDILAEWVRVQKTELSTSQHGVQERQLAEESAEFLAALQEALERTESAYIDAAEFARVRESLESISFSRLHQGFTPSEVATFIFSLRQPLFTRLRQDLASNPEVFAEQIWTSTKLIDNLGLYITELYQKGRNDIIVRQQEEMLELSTPVVQLWEGILALPLIGTLDSARTQVVMQNLLEAIVETGAEIAIIDITGVPTVDTLVAQHLLKTVAAARLMGADCIISGIRPQIAQTIIHLGVDLANVTTKATLSDAFGMALRRSGLTIVSRSTAQSVSNTSEAR